MPGAVSVLQALVFDSVDLIAMGLCVAAVACIWIRRIPWVLPEGVRPSLLFLLLAIGWVAIRAGFWGHVWLHGSHDEPPGSFPLHGVVYAREQAELWQFTALVGLIDEHWYYPKSIDTEAQPPLAHDARQRLIDGALEAERFRREILTPDARGVSHAERLVEKIIAFQQTINNGDENGFRPIDSFVLDKDDLLQRIAGTVPSATGAEGFAAFQGHWFGNWDGHDVDHLWTGLSHYEPAWHIADATNALNVHTLQYAWIGDGFGWNLVVDPVDSLDDNFVILGTVYHVRDFDPENVYLHRPHVGVETAENQLIWITEREVFLEETNHPTEPDRYTITGFFYEINQGVTEYSGYFFQSQYTRNEDDRPAFRRFSPPSLSER